MKQKKVILVSQKPLFGHPAGKVGKTTWMCFMKFPDLITSRPKE